MVLKGHVLGMLLVVLVAIQGYGQSYAEDFESFGTGSGISGQSILWEQTVTGGGPRPQTGADATVVENRSYAGSKSLYIGEGAGRNPDTDVSCSFQNLLQLGVFELDFFCYIPNGNASYFTLQGSQQIGNAMVFQFATDGNGNAYLRDYEGEELDQISYTEDVWMKMSFKVDLVNNDWIFLIDGVEQVRFASTYNSLASVQFAGFNAINRNDAGFWIDDLTYSFDAYELSSKNCEIQNTSYSGGEFVGTDAQIHCTLRNLGGNEINSILMGYVYEGILYQEEILGLSLFTSNVLDFTFAETITVKEGVSFVEIVILDVDGKTDDIQADNTDYLRIKPFVLSASKVALLEAGVSNTCGLCPSAYVAIDQFSAAYKDRVVPIIVHRNDPMDAGSSVDAMFNSFGSNLPFITVDRDGVIDPTRLGEAEADLLSYFVNKPLAQLRMGAYFSKSDTSELVVTTQLNLNDSATEEGWRLACALVEEGYRNGDASYDQKNDYFLGLRGEMGGYETEPRFIDGIDMVYSHVLRSYQPSFEGAAVALVEKSVGDSLFQSFRFTTDSSWNKDRLQLISILIKPDGTVDQAYRNDLDSVLKTGIKNVSINQSAATEVQWMSVFPNPAQHQVSIRFNTQSPATTISVVDVHGSVLSQRIALDYEPGNTAQLNTSNLVSGTYIIRIQNAKGVFGKVFQKL